MSQNLNQNSKYNIMYEPATADIRVGDTSIAGGRRGVDDPYWRRAISLRWDRCYLQQYCLF